jgi:DNA gyrase subunit B
MMATPQLETQSEAYTADDIQVLEGMEAVRRRPGMYIGGTDQRGLNQLIFEPVDNAVDEFMGGFCTHVLISIDREGVIRVEDDGRGIPVDIHQATGVSALETVMTTLHAGGKFGGKAYSVSSGLHGVGVSAVNALSEWLTVDVFLGGMHHHQKFARGEAISQLTSDSLPPDQSDKTGTVVTFKPDSEIFEDIGYDFNTLAQRFKEIAYLNKNFKVVFRSEWQIDLLETEA